MFGLTFEKLLLIGIIAVFLLGPERLPGYTAKLAQFVRSLRDMANGAKSRMRDEMGPEFDDVDWKKLDPRQYDPRRIIREALLDDGPVDGAAAGSESAVRPPSRTRPEPAYLQHKAKSAGGPVPVMEPGGVVDAGAGAAVAGVAGAGAGAAAAGAAGAGALAGAGATSTGDEAEAPRPVAAAYDSEAT